MKKPNVIIGKRQIILASLTLILGIAIYINYVYTQTGNDIKATKVVNGGQSINFGDTQLVSGENLTAAEYFAQARMNRSSTRDQAVETLKTIMNGGDSTAEEQSVATQSAVAMSELIEKENKIENLIKAAGFADCVVYLDGDSANIVVKSEGLNAQKAAQIKAILLNEVDIANEKIKIYDVN